MVRVFISRCLSALLVVLFFCLFLAVYSSLFVCVALHACLRRLRRCGAHTDLHAASGFIDSKTARRVRLRDYSVGCARAHPLPVSLSHPPSGSRVAERVRDTPKRWRPCGRRASVTGRISCPSILAHMPRPAGALARAASRGTSTANGNRDVLFSPCRQSFRQCFPQTLLVGMCWKASTLAQQLDVSVCALRHATLSSVAVDQARVCAAIERMPAALTHGIHHPAAKLGRAGGATRLRVFPVDFGRAPGADQVPRFCLG